MRSVLKVMKSVKKVNYFKYSYYGEKMSFTKQKSIYKHYRKPKLFKIIYIYIHIYESYFFRIYMLCEIINTE